MDMNVAYCSSKGEGDRERITFLIGDRTLVLRPWRGIDLQRLPRTIVSFGYTLRKLPDLDSVDIDTDTVYVNLKDMYRNIMNIDADARISRMDMARALNIDLYKYEPTSPKATGQETCYLYKAIHRALQEQAKAADH
jgi:hypothetical protein